MKELTSRLLVYMSVLQFSTDQSVVDTDISYRLAGLVFAIIQLISVVFLLSLVDWKFVLLFLVIFYISMRYQVYTFVLSSLVLSNGFPSVLMAQRRETCLDRITFTQFYIMSTFILTI